MSAMFYILYMSFILMSQIVQFKYSINNTKMSTILTTSIQSAAQENNAKLKHAAPV